MSLLVADSITRRFGGIVAVDGACLEVQEGTITGLIGPNGAGKTTLFNILSGLFPPNEGRVIFDGTDITDLPPERRSQIGLVRSFQISRGFPRLTVIENLLVYGRPTPGEGFGKAIFFGKGEKAAERALIDRAQAIAEWLSIDKVLDQPADAISGGQKKLLEIGRVLMAQPRLALFDEPIAGVNPTLAQRIARILCELRNEGLTILVIEHNMDLIAKICDPVVVMAEGKEIAKGNFQQVASDRRVQDAYMGTRHHAA